MADNYEDDELSQFPSAANPLAAMGLDPDQVRSNPDLLAAYIAKNGGGEGGYQPSQAGMPRDAVDTSKLPPGEGGPQDVQQSAAPPPAAPTSANDYAMHGLDELKKNAGLAGEAASAIRTDDPAAEALMARRSKLAAPVPLNDPTTGKMRSSVNVPTVDDQGRVVTQAVNPKPSVGSRIWRGVRGGLTGTLQKGVLGGIEGALDPSTAGQQAYGAPSTAYQKLDANRKDAVGATDADLLNQFKLAKDRVDAQKAQAGEFGKVATLDKDLTTGATGVLNAGSEAGKVQNEADKLKAETPEAKAKAATMLDEAEYNQRNARADAQHMTGINRLLYVLNKKIPDPRQPSEGEITAQAAVKALAADNLAHGLPANTPPSSLEQYNRIQSAARGGLDKGAGKVDKNADEEIGAIADDARTKAQAFATQWVRDPKTGSYHDPQFSKTLSGDQYDAKVAEIRTAANDKLAKHGAQMGADGQVTQAAAPPKPAGGNVSVTTPAGSLVFPDQKSADAYKKAAGIKD